MKRALMVLAAGLTAGGFGLADSEAVHWGDGPGRNQVSAERGLPDGFDPASGRNLRWVAELGSESYATPVVAGGRVFVGTNNERPRDPRYAGDRGVFMCFDAKDGAFRWQQAIPKVSDDPYEDWPKAGMCSTATVEGERVYMVSNRGEAMCLDARGMANGNDGPFQDEGRLQAAKGAGALPVLPAEADVLWVFDTHARVGSHPHDAANGSMLVVGNHLYLNTSNGVDSTHLKVACPGAPSLIVLDKRDGRLVARDREDIGPRIFHCTWSSPSWGEAGGRKQVVFCGGDGVVYGFEPAAEAAAGAEPAALRKLWWFDCDPKAPKEDVHRYHRKGGKWKLSPSNIFGMPVCHDGRVYLTVGGDVWWGKEEAWLKCIEAGGNGDVTATAEVWSYPLVRHTMCTPAVHEGLVYAADTDGNLHCVDAATGQGVWKHETGGPIWASPLVADGKVYLGNRRGDFTVLAAGREKKVLSTVRLDSGISGTATAAGGVLYVATMKRLYAVGL